MIHKLEQEACPEDHDDLHFSFLAPSLFSTFYQSLMPLVSAAVFGL